MIQRRVDESVDFNSDWDVYEAGFGVPELNYWMGLKNIHYMTKHPVELYIYLEKFDGETAYVRYNTTKMPIDLRGQQLHKFWPLGT